MTPAPQRPLARFGPYFALDVGVDPSGGWVPWAEVTTSTALHNEVLRIHLAISRGTELSARVSASTMSLSLFARLVSPVIAATVLDLRLPHITAETLYWKAAPGGPPHLGVRGDIAPAEPGAFIDEVVLPLVPYLSETYSLSEHILRGNVASSLFGAATVMASIDHEAGARARSLASDLLASHLSDAGRITHRFVRNSCCLYYRVPGGGYCGDCVLVQRS